MSENNKQKKTVFEKSSIEQLYIENKDALKRWVSRFLHRPQDIEDIVQETFIRSYQANQGKSIDNPAGYIFRTARNLSFKSNERHIHKLTQYIEELDLAEVVGDMDPVLSQLESHEKFSFFWSAVKELPVQCRRVFVLKNVYGLSHEEIAAQLGITISTSHQHLAKGLARCTADMREKGMLDAVDKSKESQKGRTAKS